MLFFMLIGFFVIQQNLLSLLKYDKQTYTQSDFTVVGRNMKFDDYSAKGMEDEVRNHFKKKYGVYDIEYICPAFRIGDYFKVVE